MSGATYRIDVEHRPSDTDTPYYASICRLSDGYYVDVKSGRTADEALNRARGVVATLLSAQQDTKTYFVDDDAAFVPSGMPLTERIAAYGGFGETYAVEVEPLARETRE